MRDVTPALSRTCKCSMRVWVRRLAQHSKHGQVDEMQKNLLFVLILAASSLSSVLAEEAKDAPPVISPQEAAQHDGKLVTVHGVVDAQRDSQKGITYLNFGGKFPNQVFTCLLRPKNFGGAAENYTGKTVEVTGFVRMHEGKPSMDLTGPDKIKIIINEGSVPADKGGK